MPKLFGLCHSAPSEKPTAGTIPEDPLAKGLRDCAEVESLFAVVEAYAQELSGTLSRLKQIPSPLMEGFEKSVGEGCGDEDTWRLLAAQVDTCIARVAGGLSHLEELLHFLPRIQQRFTQVTEAAAQREESWAIKAWRDREAEDAKTRRMSQKAKSARQSASVQATDDFQSSTVILQAAMDQVLTNRAPDTTAVLQLLSECYAGVFGDEAKPSLGTLGNIDASTDVSNDATNWNKAPDCDLAPLPSYGPLSTNSMAHGSVAHGSVAASTKMLTPPPAPTAGGSKTQPAQGSLAPPAPSTVHESTASTTQQAHGSAAAPARSNTQVSTGSTAPMTFSRGEKVQIWSSSQGKWLEGLVTEVFERGGTHEEYYVPAGVVKVESIAGTKFVQPDQLAAVLRKLPT